MHPDSHTLAPLSDSIIHLPDDDVKRNCSKAGLICSEECCGIASPGCPIHPGWISGPASQTAIVAVLFFSMEAPLYIFADKALQQFGTMDIQKAA
jgi:hypothetical protein